MERSSFFNSINGDRRYKAEDYANYFGMFISNGYFPNVGTNLQVIADGTNMKVKLKAGAAWVNGYMYQNTDDLNLNIEVADGVLNRIDRVIVQLNFSNRNIQAKVKKGVFNSVPTPPALQRDADIYELAIADIAVNKGVTSITQAVVTDLRLNKELCGVVNSILQADTTTIFNQYQDWFNRMRSAGELQLTQFMVEQQQAFQTWFNIVKEQLDGDVAGKLNTRLSQVESAQSTLIQSLTTHKSELASTTKVGHVQLSNSTTSTSEEMAATSKAVKDVMDKANASETQINARKRIEQTSFKIKKLNKDSNGTYLTIEYSRKSDGTLACRSVISGGTIPNYTTRTLTYYGLDGTTVEKTEIFTLSYDSDGQLVSEV